MTQKPSKTQPFSPEVFTFQAMFHQANDAHFLVNLENGTFIAVNHALERMIGTTIKNDSMLKIGDISPEYQPNGLLSEEAIGNHIAAAMQHGAARFEWQHIRLDNQQPFMVEVAINKVQSDAHHIVYGTWHDITQRKREEIEREQIQQQLIDAQQAAIREMSTPLIPLSKHVVLMPIIGHVDTQRAQMIMETLLQGVEQYKARFVIMDITGVSVVDTQIAQVLVWSAQAVRLLGTHAILTGIGPGMAQSLVHLGTDLGNIITVGSLEQGIAYAMSHTHMRAWQ